MTRTCVTPPRVFFSRFDERECSELAAHALGAFRPVDVFRRFHAYALVKPSVNGCTFTIMYTRYVFVFGLVSFLVRVRFHRDSNETMIVVTSRSTGFEVLGPIMLLGAVETFVAGNVLAALHVDGHDVLRILIPLFTAAIFIWGAIASWRARRASAARL